MQIWEYVNNTVNALGEIPCIILFMVATTSTQWIVCDLFFLLLQQLFCYFQYVHSTPLLALKFAQCCMMEDLNSLVPKARVVNEQEIKEKYQSYFEIGI